MAKESSTEFLELDRRLATLESAERRTPRWIDIVRIVAFAPIFVMPFLFAMQLISGYLQVPIGVVCVIGWACSIVILLFAELFGGKRLRFSLLRLAVATALLCTALGVLKIQVLKPLHLEQQVLAFVHGLTKSVHREPFGPPWMRWVLGDQLLERVIQLGIAGPEGGNADVKPLVGLPHLRCVFLTGPGFTDDCSNSVTKLPRGTSVVFANTAVTATAIQSMRSRRPDLDLLLQ